MQSSFVRSTVYSGHYLGLLFSVNFILRTISNPELKPSTGMHFDLSPIFVGLIVFLSYFFLSNYKNRECEGVIDFKTSFLYVFISGFYASLLSSIVKLVYVIFINKELLSVMRNIQLEVFQKMKFPDMGYVTSITDALYQPVPFSIMFLMSDMIYVAFLALFVALIIKKR